MPKLKGRKTLTRTLYTYVRPINNQWVRSNYKKYGFSSYSEFMDSIISRYRTRSTGRKEAKAA